MVQQSCMRAAASAIPGHETEQSERVLSQLSRTARDSIPRTDYASVLVRLADGRLQTIGATDAVVWPVATLQEGLSEGPGYDVVTDHLLRTTGDLTTDAAWPTYGPKAAALGVRSQLAIRVQDVTGMRIGLNLYSRDRDAFGHPQTAARVLIPYARAILSGVDDLAWLRAARMRRSSCVSRSHLG